MKQVLKPLFVLFITVLCLNSDTTQSALQFQDSRYKVQRSEQCSSMNSSAYVGIGPMPKSLAYRKWIPQPLTPPCVSALK